MKCSEWLGWLPISEEDVTETSLRAVEIIRAAREGKKEIIRLEAENVTLHKQLDKKFELIAQQGQELNRRDEIIKKQEKDIDTYAQFARVIALHLDRFCDRGLPYGEMIADAARKADLEFAEKKKEIERLNDAVERRDRMLADQSKALSDLQGRFDIINSFEQSQCAKLLVKIAERDKALTRVTEERDTALNDLRGKCSVCVHYTPNHREGVCAYCSRDYTSDVIACSDCWQWRGQQKEDGGNDNQ